MKKFEIVPPERWQSPPKYLIQAWTNKEFLVQINQEKSGLRITINKLKHSIVKGKPIWNDGITWDEIQEIKSFIGFGDKWAVECFPPDDQLVNVANMRHIWIYWRDREVLLACRTYEGEEAIKCDPSEGWYSFEDEKCRWTHWWMSVRSSLDKPNPPLD